MKRLCSGGNGQLRIDGHTGKFGVSSLAFAEFVQMLPKGLWLLKHIIIRYHITMFTENA